MIGNTLSVALARTIPVWASILAVLFLEGFAAYEIHDNLTLNVLDFITSSTPSSSGSPLIRSCISPGEPRAPRIRSNARATMSHRVLTRIFRSVPENASTCRAV